MPLRPRRKSRISLHSWDDPLGELLRELPYFLPYITQSVKKFGGFSSKNHLSSSKSSFRSGKKSRGSRTANKAKDARDRNASPSKKITSHRRAQASKGR